MNKRWIGTTTIGATALTLLLPAAWLRLGGAAFAQGGGQAVAPALAPAPPREARLFAGCPGDPAIFHKCALEKAKAYHAPRTPDGKPNFEGYWANAVNSAPWDLEAHPASFGVPGGPSLVVDTADGKIPYTPAALAKRNDIIENHPYDDPQAHCAPAGVPRQNYTPFGLQFIQPPGYFVILYEAQHMYRIIPTDGRPHIPSSIKLWQGDSVGHWEGDTLVVDYANSNGKHWLEMAGNFETPNIHVVERFTLVDADTIHYEARIEDSTIYTRPWTIAMPFARNKTKNYYLLEFACREGEHDLQHYVDADKGEQFKHTPKKP